MKDLAKKDQYRSVFNIATAIAAGIAALLAILVPLGYFSISYQYLSGTLDSDASQEASSINALILANPEMRAFEQVRLEELLAKRDGADLRDTRRIYDNEGRIVAQNAGNLDYPLISRSHRLYYAGMPVGTIEITVSILPLLSQTSLVALASLLVGLLLFCVLRSLPLRAVRRAVTSLEESERRYRSLSASMKEGVALCRVEEGNEERPSTFSILDINTTCERLFKLRKSEIVGREGSLVSLALGRELPRILRTMTTGETLAFEFPLEDEERILSASIFHPGGGISPRFSRTSPKEGILRSRSSGWPISIR